MVRDCFKIGLKAIVCGVVDWIHPTQGRYQWQAFVNAVMNIGFHKRRDIY